jgi:hypothetical protein
MCAEKTVQFTVVLSFLKEILNVFCATVVVSIPSTPSRTVMAVFDWNAIFSHILHEVFEGVKTHCKLGIIEGIVCGHQNYRVKFTTKTNDPEAEVPTCSVDVIAYVVTDVEVVKHG